VSLHQYGTTFATNWIDISTTTSATPLPGADDNALAKAAGATPFKRPENLAFRPGSKFKELYFDETGDTDSRTCAGGGAAPNPNLPACTTRE
jgi:secreted PhoX family phosphatase